MCVKVAVSHAHCKRDHLQLGLAIDKPSAEFEVAAVQVATCYKDRNLKATQNIGNLVVYGA